MELKERLRRIVATTMIVGLVIVTIPQDGEAGWIDNIGSLSGAVVFSQSGCMGWPIAYYPLMGYSERSRNTIAKGNPNARSVRVAGFCHDLNSNADLNSGPYYAYRRANCRGPMRIVANKRELQEGRFASYRVGAFGSCESTRDGFGNGGRWF